MKLKTFLRKLFDRQKGMRNFDYALLLHLTHNLTRLKKTLSTMTQSVEAERRSIDAATIRLRQLEDRLALITKADRRIKKGRHFTIAHSDECFLSRGLFKADEINEINEILGLLKTSAKEIKDLTNSIATHEEVINETVREERFVREQCEKTIGRHKRLQAQFEKKRCESELALKEIESERTVLEDQLQHQRKQVG